jgi:hypothetical protein
MPPVCLVSLVLHNLKQAVSCPACLQVLLPCVSASAAQISPPLFTLMLLQAALGVL